MSPYTKIKNGEWNLGYLSANPELLKSIITDIFDPNKIVNVLLIDNRTVEAKVVYYNVKDDIFCIKNDQV